MKQEVTGEVQMIIIPKIKYSSMEFGILELLYEEGSLFYRDMAEISGKNINNIRSVVSRLRKKGLVKTWLDWSIRLTPAGKWYYEEYEILEKTMFK